MKKLPLLFIVTLLVTGLSGCDKQTSTTSEEPFVSAYNPEEIFDGYYKGLKSWKNGVDLKNQLYQIVYRDYHAIPYVSGGANWDTNRNADQSLTNFDKVHLLYSDIEEYKITGNNSTNWQREHCWPASLMTGLGTGDAVKELGTATDFHNLYASYSSANSSHSNNCYGNIPDDDENVRYVGTAKSRDDDPYTDINEAAFEPGDKDKGKVARAIFYMGLMYGKDSWVKAIDKEGHKLSIGLQIVSKTSGTKCSLMSAQMGTKCHQNLEDLIEWNNAFLPDRLEYQHTNVVQSEQGNRNPFVDFPGLVDYVYGSKQRTKGSLINIPNAYDILDLANDNVHNIAVKNVRYSYDGGDIFDSSKDLEVYTVTNSFKVEKTDKYVVSGVNDKDTLSFEQNGKLITINYDNNLSYSYNINVAPKEWNEFNYKFTMLPDGLGKGQNKVSYNGVTWNIDFGDAKTIKALDRNGEPYGVNVGSKSSPANNISLETESDFCYDNNYVIKKIFIETNTSNEYYGSYNVTMSIGGKNVYSKRINHIAHSSLQTVGVSLGGINQKIGKVKIDITNVATGFRIGRVGILVEKTRG